MDPMLECFISESRENLETAGQCFLALEKSPENEDLLNDLFRAMHTMKGSSGLFEIPAFTQVVHAAEDVLDAVRDGKLLLTPAHIDLFLDMMDQVNMWLDDLENQETLSDGSESVGATISANLRALLINQDSLEVKKHDCKESKELIIENNEQHNIVSFFDNETPDWVSDISEEKRIEIVKKRGTATEKIYALEYFPNEQCFFAGEDPLHTVLNIPNLLWFIAYNKNNWPKLVELDPYTCSLSFAVISDADFESLTKYTRYIYEEVKITALHPLQLMFPTGEFGDNEPFETFIKEARTVIENEDWETLKKLVAPLIEISGSELRQTSALKWMQLLLTTKLASKSFLLALFESIVTGEYISPYHSENNIEKLRCELDDGITNTKAEIPTVVSRIEEEKVVTQEQLAAISKTIETQTNILSMPCSEELLIGRISSVGQVLKHIFTKINNSSTDLEEVIEQSKQEKSQQPLLDYIKKVNLEKNTTKTNTDSSATIQEIATIESEQEIIKEEKLVPDNKLTKINEGASNLTKVLKVDQQRIDTLMDLVGELVVAKNALPFIAKKAENEYGIRTLSKEILSQYAVINRLSEELQSTMMQIRMVPVSTVFQRFPRLVRDLSRKLGKKINLILEGEETEADKTVVESLADPLIHLVRNSLDHGLETNQERLDSGKAEEGTIILKAISNDDEVIIEVKDDGRGIDPIIIKRKAYEKGIIDEQTLDTITDQEAMQLILAAGFSTAKEISDLSGRGVGMDVVHSVVSQAGGNVVVYSELGKGTTIRLSLPLSMAVSRVMMIELGQQTYGISMDNIIETVRFPADQVKKIKHNDVVVLRERLIPIFYLRQLLGEKEQEKLSNEIAILVMVIQGKEIGLVIDDFQQGIDIIQKPLEGVMANYPYYSGAALLGDGRVLLILNIKELLSCR